MSEAAANSPVIPPVNRQQPRVASTGLEAAIVHRRMIWLTDYEYCYLLNVNSGGLGIASRTYDVKVGKRIELEIYHGTKTYPVRGIVIHKAHRDGKHHYGLAFVETPAELDELVAAFVQSHVAKESDRAQAGGTSKRQPGEHRVTIDAQIYVRRAGSNESFLLCRVENVSRGGLGFSCIHRFDGTPPYDLEVRISEHPDATLAIGAVVHVQKRLDRHHYGMVFRQVPDELVRLVELLEHAEA